MPRYLLGKDGVVGLEYKIFSVSRKPQPSVPKSPIANFRFNVRGDRVFRKTPQRLANLLDTRASGAGIPNRKWRHAVRVNMFGGLDQLGETNELIPRGAVARAIHFNKDGVVTLDDQRVLRVVMSHGHEGRSTTKLISAAKGRSAVNRKLSPGPLNFRGCPIVRGK